MPVISCFRVSTAEQAGPAWAAAMQRARVEEATLVIAKLDRLSRNVAFFASLQDSGARFLAADMPEANELTVHIMAAVAQAERKAIGERTRAARNWLGRQDSNLRMPVPKTGALPLGDAPMRKRT